MLACLSDYSGSGSFWQLQASAVSEAMQLSPEIPHALVVTPDVSFHRRQLSCVVASDQSVLDALSPPMTTVGTRIRNFLRCRILRPLLRLLRGGVTTKQLAWSLAIALIIGVNPLLGTTTVIMLAIAWLFNLNQVATQIGIHLVAPLQWLLFVPFVHAGTLIFRTHGLPMSRKAILHLSHRHPIQLIHLLWQWEWHALVIWAVFAAGICPLLAFQIRRVLVHALRRHQDLLV